mmetsp:Transcript_7099/g.17005  ORF Transcript_7099/g.17005 Transcript_7099/m.17005 type:complete len:241 (+) Transcript_7099:1802-2524(+)
MHRKRPESRGRDGMSSGNLFGGESGVSLHNNSELETIAREKDVSRPKHGRDGIVPTLAGRRVEAKVVDKIRLQRKGRATFSAIWIGRIFVGYNAETFHHDRASTIGGADLVLECRDGAGVDALQGLDGVQGQLQRRRVDLHQRHGVVAGIDRRKELGTVPKVVRKGVGRSQIVERIRIGRVGIAHPAGEVGPHVGQATVGERAVRGDFVRGAAIGHLEYALSRSILPQRRDSGKSQQEGT